MDGVSKDYIAYITPFGKYRHTVIPFGLTNGPPTYAILNAMVFKGRLGDRGGSVIEAFFDDNGMGSNTFENHLQLLQEAFKCYSNVGMSLNPSKCKFFLHEIVFLGHILNEQA